MKSLETHATAGESAGKFNLKCLCYKYLAYFKFIHSFLPGMKQIANVAALPGIVGSSVGLPDVHSGYGFAIGNMAAFDMNDPESIGTCFKKLNLY